MSERHRIATMTLDERTVVRRSADIEHERKVAIFDLLDNNHFRPACGLPGPNTVLLSVEENRGEIETLEMGRRGLHNDGSVILRERLADKIDIDHDTARRLFTLLCVLHLRA